MTEKVYSLLKALIPRRLGTFACWVIAFSLFILHLVVGGMLLPFVRLRFALLRTERLGHFALEPDLFLRRRWIRYRSRRASRDFTIFIRGYFPPANEQLLKMWQRELFIVHLPLLHYVLRETKALWLRSYFYTSIDLVANEYDEFNVAPPTLRFTPDEEAEGRGQLAEWGIDLDRDWFVCIFARDDKYLKNLDPRSDFGYHDYRNSDIDTLNPAIHEIVRRGGFVLRMGFHVGKPLSIKSDRVIDYAVAHRSDFMDIFLSAKCRLFLGSAAGISNVSIIFDRPCLGVNFTPFGSGPIGKESLFIPKLVADVSTRTRLTFGALLRDFSQNSDPKIGDGKLAFLQGYQYIDNTAEEILAVTREMLDRLDNKYEPAREMVDLQRRYAELVPTDHWCVGVKTPIGGDFLKLHEELLR